LMTTTGTSDGVQFEELPLARQVITGADEFIGGRFLLEDCFPNPVKDKTTIRFRTNNTGHVSVCLYDGQGKKVKIFKDEVMGPGYHKIEANLIDLPDGHYKYQLKSGFFKDSKTLMIIK
jgi:hypothetical protein